MHELSLAEQLVTHFGYDPDDLGILYGAEATASQELEQVEREALAAQDPEHPTHQRQWSIEMRLAQGRTARRAIHRRQRRRRSRLRGHGPTVDRTTTLGRLRRIDWHREPKGGAR